MTLHLVPPVAAPPVDDLSELLSEYYALRDYEDILRDSDPFAPWVADEFATARQRRDEIEKKIDAIKDAKWRAWEIERMGAR